MRTAEMFLLGLIFWGAACSRPVPVIAASHAGNTWLPCGAVRLVAGETKTSFPLPTDYTGVLPHPMVFLAIYISGQEGRHETTLKIQIGEQTLPDWPLRRNGTAYVVNLDTIRTSPSYGESRLDLQFFADMEGGEIHLYALGTADPLLVSSTLNGPLSTFTEATEDEEVKTYLQGLIAQFSDRPERARKLYRDVRLAKNETVGQYARRNLRLLKGILRTPDDIKTFAQRYRWGLYFQQCGLFQKAMEEFYACTLFDGLHGGAWFRLGEMAERCGSPSRQIANYIERSGEVAAIGDPTVWNVLVTFLREREVHVLRDGEEVIQILRISDEDVARLKDEWVLVEKQVFGASRGTFRLNTSFYDIKDEKHVPFVRHAGWLPGPADELIEHRGWFDSVISIRPHLSGEIEQTGGGDCGPNGAGLSDLDSSADWQRMFHHWNHQFDWTVIVGEYGIGYPITHDAVGCGHGPIPNEGYGLRAAMRYYLTAAMYRRAKIVPTVPPVDPPPAFYARYWRVYGPYSIDEEWPADGSPRSRVLDPLPQGANEPYVILDSDTDFIDLKAVLGDRGWALARAVCWIKSPEPQHVQMWLGYNDGMAVWVNGQPVRRGRYYASGKYADPPARGQVDMVASYATLEAGWNRVEAVIEGWPSPRNSIWGFSARFTAFDGRPVTNLRYSASPPEGARLPTYAPPETGYHYSWEKCREAYHELLPELNDAALVELTGLKGIRVRGSVEGRDGMVAIEVPRRTEGGAYRPIPEKWDVDKDSDARLNNVLDWAREDVCAVRFTKDGVTRDLLVMKPEAFEAYLTLIREPPEAVEVYGQLAPADRVVGYVRVPAAGESARTLLVADVMLSRENETWPHDEEDLLDPYLR